MGDRGGENEQNAIFTKDLTATILNQTTEHSFIYVLQSDL